MALNASLPANNQPLVDQSGRTTRPFYRFFSALQDVQQADSGSQAAAIATLNAEVAQIATDLGSPDGTVGNIPAQNRDNPILQVLYPLFSNGLLQNGFAQIGLRTLTDDGNGALLALERDAYGRVSGTHPATITGTTGEIDVADGDAVAGLPTLGLADVPDGGAGVLQKTAFDAKGRKTDTSAATTDDLTEGATNLYFTNQRADDAVGAALADTANIDLAYDGTNITADLTDTGVTPGTYGDGTNVPQITLDGKGRATSITTVPITAGDASYIFTQGTPSATWNISHGLGKFPSITVVDSANTVVIGDEQYVDANNVTVSFSAAFSGQAFLN